MAFSNKSATTFSSCTGDLTASFKLSLLVLAKLCKLVAKLGVSDIDAFIVVRPFDDPVIFFFSILIFPFRWIIPQRLCSQCFNFSSFRFTVYSSSNKQLCDNICGCFLFLFIYLYYELSKMLFVVAVKFHGWPSEFWTSCGFYY